MFNRLYAVVRFTTFQLLIFFSLNINSNDKDMVKLLWQTKLVKQFFNNSRKIIKEKMNS